MFAKNFNSWNTALGWLVFVVALITYVITVEPTVSFWDSGEYIASSSNLEVSHPPGAPLFQIIGAFFSMFAMEPVHIAKMVNYVSVVSSAFTILFLFWVITNLCGKMMDKNEGLTNHSAMVVLGSGTIGSLAYTFSDSFWFNAVETEVYAMASLVMALLLWLGLKWTDNMGDPRGNRWLVLISFVTGLTFGIQFMGFLAIPSIVLLYCFKKYKTVALKNFLWANCMAVAILMLVFKFSLTYILMLFGWSEVFFVNTMGLPFNSGSVIMGIALVLAFFFGLRYSRKKGFVTMHNIILSVMFLFLGFSSWLMLPIRANSNVVINESNPSDARSLLAYYNREQYPSVDSPFYGAYYSDRFAPSGEKKDDRPKYEQDKKTGKYTVVNAYKGASKHANNDHIGFLPRMWSQTHAENYIRYFGPLEFKIRPQHRSNEELQAVAHEIREEYASGKITEGEYMDFLQKFGSYIEVVPPSIWKNVTYMVAYQFGYMYWRYFMWNFVGKQDDEQGKYDDHGNWLSGIDFIDGLHLGSQKNIPSDVKNNKGRNTYYFLPLLLGIAGLFFHFYKSPKQFWVLLVFFLLTGIGIQFYTNPPIFQPRERDYSLVGSFFVFSIWIGIGVTACFNTLKKWLPSKLFFPVLFLTCLLSVPGVMAYENWDDHDRSNRYTARSMAKSYLDSIQENAGAILFTIGDNDTFSLWYAQQIEKYRTDVRTVVTGYLQADWYIDQMKRKAYKSDPAPSQLTHDKYSYGTRDVLYHQPLTDKRWDIKDFMNWVGSNNPQTKIKSLLQKQGADLSGYSENDLETVYYPTNKIRVPVNKKNVLESGLVKKKEEHLIVEYIDIDLPSVLGKNNVMMLDILANNDWERPIYFSGGSFDDSEYLWMKDYLQLDGLVYKLVPIKTAYRGAINMGRIDTDLMYGIVKKWQWGNSGSPTIYHDPQTRRQGGVSFRLSMARLVEALIAEHKITKAKEIIDLAMAHLPVEHFGYFSFVEPFLDGYYKVGDIDQGRKVYHQLKKIYQERLAYYAEIPLEEQYVQLNNIIADVQAYQRNMDILVENEDEELAVKEMLRFREYIEKFPHFFNGETLR